MNTGKACAIFEKIDSGEYTAAEKREAIIKVINMGTHNGITKEAMLRVIRYLYNGRTGCWIGAEDEMGCSECGSIFNYCDNDCERFKYCPNCGANMNPEDDEI